MQTSCSASLQCETRCKTSSLQAVPPHVGATWQPPSRKVNGSQYHYWGGKVKEVKASDGISQHKESFLWFWKDKTTKTPHDDPEIFSWLKLLLLSWCLRSSSSLHKLRPGDKTGRDRGIKSTTELLEHKP